MVFAIYYYYIAMISCLYLVLQIKLLAVREHWVTSAATLFHCTISKGAAVLVEHEASAELDNVDDDYVWRGRRT